MASLNAVDGAPTLRATHWVDETSTIPGVPGTWSLRGEEVVVALPDGTDALVNGVPRSGEIVARSQHEQFAPRLQFPGATTQVTTREGRHGVRVFDHAKAGAIAELEAFEPSPSWVVAGTFSPLPGSSSQAYGYALESMPRETEVPGVVSFTLDGQAYETRPFLDGDGLLLVFADDTTGVTSKAPGRFLWILLPSGADVEQPVILDFDRAFLPPCAFSDEFNCPLPPVGHRFATSVSAGERFPRWKRDGAASVG